MVKKEYYVLVVVFLLVLGLRLFFAFSTAHFSDDRAYFALRQVEHITETGLPLYGDDLSYQGRVHVLLPLFYYSLAFFGIFMPITLVFKIIPNIFASSLVFVVYAIAQNVTKDRRISVFAAAVSAITPIFVSQTINSVSPYTLVIPLMFLSVYFFMRISEDRKYATFFVLCFFALTFTHASVTVLVFGVLLYLLWARVEGLSTSRSELEVALFSIFFVIWCYFVVFKKLFLSYGASVFWQNIPAELLSQYFGEITILSTVNQIGLVPLFTGIYILYVYIFRMKDKAIYLLTGLTLGVALLLWLGLLSVNDGLIILGVVLVLYFAQFFKLFLQYIEKTKLLRLKPYIVVFTVVLFAATSLIPTFFYADREIRRGFTDDEIDAMLWIRGNTNQTDVVLGTVREGHLISAVAQRPNMMDSNFLLVPEINERLEDLRTIFSTSSEIEVVRLLNKYNIRYIYFSNFAKLQYKRTSLPYTDDVDCFQLVYDKEVQIYKTHCKLETIT